MILNRIKENGSFSTGLSSFECVWHCVSSFLSIMTFEIKPGNAQQLFYKTLSVRSEAQVGVIAFYSSGDRLERETPLLTSDKEAAASHLITSRGS